MAIFGKRGGENLAQRGAKPNKHTALCTLPSQNFHSFRTDAAIDWLILRNFELEEVSTPLTPITLLFAVAVNLQIFAASALRW